jgi:hypothetical protein
MRYPAASSGISPRGIILFAASGGEFDPERLRRRTEAESIGLPHRSGISLERREV